jgi:hypothetical protein
VILRVTIRFIPGPFIKTDKLRLYGVRMLHIFARLFHRFFGFVKLTFTRLDRVPSPRLRAFSASQTHLPIMPEV